MEMMTMMLLGMVLVLLGFQLLLALLVLELLPPQSRVEDHKQFHVVYSSPKLHFLQIQHLC